MHVTPPITAVCYTDLSGVCAMYNYKPEYFNKILETGSITEAARQLYISQSALSQYVISLEKHLGTKLFDRSTTPISLTYEGRLFLKMLQEIIEAEANLKHSLEDIRNACSGEIRIGISVLRAQLMLHLLLPTFKANYPDVSVILLDEHNGDLVNLVLEGKVDIAFISRRTISPQLNCISLTSSEILLSAPPNHPICAAIQGEYDWRNRTPIDLYQLRNEPFIMMKDYPHFTQQINQIFDEYQFDPKVYLRVSDFYTAHQLSLHGAGFTFIHDILALQGNRHGAYFLLDRGPVSSELKLCYKKGHYLTRAMQTFIDITQHTCEALYQRASFNK